MANAGPGALSLSNHRWTARVRGAVDGTAVAYARNQSFGVSSAASFRESDPQPSAVEYVLGALGGDLVTGFAAACARSGIAPHAVEASVSGQLQNPLVYLGVVGERGHPGFDAIRVTLYVRADAEEERLRRIWQETLARSPLARSLSGGAAVSYELSVAL